jgi:hypothetical protein
MEISSKDKIRVWLFLSTVFFLLTGISACDPEDNPPDDPAFVRLLEKQTYQSTILKRSMDYAVLLPAEYENSTDSFPVVYLLHG